MRKLTNTSAIQMLTTREVASLLGTVEWRVRRLFEDGTLDEPFRFAGKRVIMGEDIPVVVDALRSRGWLNSSRAGDEQGDRQ